MDYKECRIEEIESVEVQNRCVYFYCHYVTRRQRCFEDFVRDWPTV